MASDPEAKWTCNTDGKRCSFPNCVPCDDSRIMYPVSGSDVKPMNAVLPEPPLKSKATLFDVFRECKECHVKKYTNADTRLCFKCHVAKDTQHP